MKHKNTGLHSIFSSNFYIDEFYAKSLAPLAISLFQGQDPTSGMTTAQLIANAQSMNGVAGSDGIVAILSIKQPIVKYNSWDFLGTKTYQSILSDLSANPNVIGVVLDVDSGGGQSYGTAEFYDFLSNYNKPIVTYTDGYLCSAAYYFGSAADYIVANKRSEAIGSIGAYASFVDFSGIFEKLGAKSHTIYATESTEKNKDYRELFENGDPTPYIKNQLDPLVKTFQADMLAARPDLDESTLKGGTWGAEQAKELNLIDEIGSLNTAVLKVIELAQNSNSNSNTMSKEQSFPKLAAVLGSEVDAKKAHIFAASETVSLSVDQLSQIEAALTDPDGAQQLSDLQTQLQAAEARANEAENKATALETAVSTAVSKAGLTASSTTVETITHMSDMLVEWGAKGGAETTNVHSKGDQHDVEAESTSIYESIVTS